MGCHFERSEKSSIETKKDISCLRTQYNKNLESIKFAPQSPAYTQVAEHLDSNNYTENTHLIKLKTLYSQGLFSLISSSKKAMESEITCCIGCSKTFHAESKRDVSPFFKEPTR